MVARVKERLDDEKLPLTDHLKELRDRLLVSIAALLLAFIFCYLFAEEIYNFLVAPLAAIYQGQEGRKLIYTGLTEAFMTYMSVAFWAALMISFPIIATQFYKFLSPGLYKKEKKFLIPFLVASPVLFIMGAALAYYFVFPMAWQFFLGFETSGLGDSGLPIKMEARVSEYLSLVMQLIFAFGLAFQMPVVLTLLARAGLLKSESLKKKRKYAVIGIFVVAAFLTPPDVISQIGLALPLLLLYECSIFSCRMVEKKEE